MKDKTEYIRYKVKNIIKELYKDIIEEQQENKFIKELNEGLLKTEDIIIASNKLRLFLVGFNDIKFNVEINKEEQRIYVTIFNIINIKNIDSFIKRVMLLGYYPSYYEISIKNSDYVVKKNYNNIQFKNDLEEFDNEYQYIYFIIEPKFDKKPDSISKEYYHVTRKLFVDKILNNGFVPKKIKSEHPERIYFTDSLQKAIEFKKQLEEKYPLIKKNELMPDDEYIILKIDGKCLDKKSLYIDYNFKNGFYTYSNISNKDKDCI